MRHDYRAVFVVACVGCVCALYWPSAASRGQQREKPVVGITYTTPGRTDYTIEELCGKAPIVAEVVAMNRRNAREDDPSASAERKRAVTPTTVKVARVYKNEGPVSLSPGSEVTVLERFGRVETDSYIVDSKGKSAFNINGLHVVFLECAVDAECHSRGPILQFNGNQVVGLAMAQGVIAGGVGGVREALKMYQPLARSSVPR